MLLPLVPKVIPVGIGPLVIVTVAAIILQNLSMVEANWVRKFPQIKEANGFSIICRFRSAGGRRQEYHTEGVLPGIPAGVGVGIKHFDKLDVQGNFFLGFPQGCRFQGFSVVHKASGQGPAVGRILPLN